jgi:STE24 endopeptidase
MQFLLIGFIVAATTWTAFSLWLSVRQMACVRRNRDTVPADFAASVTIEEHRKAADYTLARERLACVGAVVDLAVSLAWVLAACRT